MRQLFRLSIDGVEIEMLNEPDVNLTYDAASTRSIDKAKSGDYLDFEIESPLSTLSIFDGEGYPHTTRFNSTEHSATLEYEGVVIYEGVFTLRSVNRSGWSVTYGVRISCSGAEWATLASETLISETPIEYEMTLRTDDLKAEWEDFEQPIHLFPVSRDSYDGTMSSVSFETVRQLLTVDDYHPFLRITPIVESIAEVGGYELESDFFSCDEGQKLYMSGSYASQESAVAKEYMDFQITKLSDESATADYMGRVSIAGSQTSSAISTIVDIESLDEDSQCYSRSNCLSVVDDAVQFTPTTEVNVGFEYRLHYTTEYQITTRDTLMGFDTFFLGESPEVKVELVNNFADERGEEVMIRFTYLIMVFDHQDGASYLLRGRVNGSSSYNTLSMWSARTVSYTTPLVGSIEDITLDILDGDEYVEYTEDWAMYQGYITEWGETEVDVTIRTSPNTLRPSSPKRFESMYVQGAESGMSFSLLADTTITPYFAEYPGYGDVVDYSDLSQHDNIQQGELIESLQHLFNLRYYTDRSAHKLYIEPLESLYDHSVVWDWSERVLPEQGFIYEDCAIDISRERLWGWQMGDGAISRSDPEFGEWSYTLGNYSSSDQSTSLLNPIFSPSLNDDDGTLVVGDRDDESLAGSLEFSPRVVSYRGLDDSGTPRVVFHSVEEGVSLCFEDRDDMVGLNQYYASQIDREERGCYVTVWLRVEPYEVVELFSPLEGRASLLSTFKLHLDGEWCEVWIEAIEEYHVGSGVAKVKFIML